MITFLSSEVTKVILDFLDGLHITLLYKTGYKSLIFNLTMRGDVKTFRQTLSPGRTFVWPSILSKFPFLEHVSLVSPYYYHHVPVYGIQALQLPKTLRSLELQFMNGQAALCEIVVGPNGPRFELVDLNDIYPKLTMLNCTQPLLLSPLNLNLAHLPSTLVSCSLQEPITAKRIALLPRRLQTLKCIVLHEEGPLPLDLPPELVTLVIHRITCATAFSFIPATVTDLIISFNSIDKDWEKSDASKCFGLGWLTCTALRRLKVESIQTVESIDDEAFRLVPSTVTDLSVTLDSLVCGSPRFLRRLSVLRDPERFIRLEIASLVRRDDIVNLETLQKCWSPFVNLQTIQLPQAYSTPFIPKKATTMWLSQVDRSVSSMLPRGLKSLTALSIADLLDDEVHVSNPLAYEGIDEDAEWNFPSSLTYLRVESTVTKEALENLVENAKNLFTLKCWAIEGQILAKMPSSLTSLDFGLHSDETFTDLPEMPNLTSLNLSFVALHVEDHLIKSFLRALASNAPKLDRLAFDATNISGECLSYLTNRALPHLKSLSLTVHSLDDQDVSSLPRSLTHLFLFSHPSLGQYSFTAHGLEQLPSGLVTLTLPFVTEPPPPQALSIMFPLLVHCTIQSCAPEGQLAEYRPYFAERNIAQLQYYYGHH